MTTAKAIRHLVRQLKKDEGYRIAWKANIAMSYIDNWYWYKRKTGKRQMNAKDRHIIANNAADYFLKLLSSGARNHEKPE